MRGVRKAEPSPNAVQVAHLRIFRRGMLHSRIDIDASGLGLHGCHLPLTVDRKGRQPLMAPYLASSDVTPA